jgi:hypothetical protein
MVIEIGIKQKFVRTKLLTLAKSRPKKHQARRKAGFLLAQGNR